MNKTFTLAALGLLLAVSANAQKVRKTWDFREGFSSATVANLYADMEQNGTAAHWRDWFKSSPYLLWDGENLTRLQMEKASN